jgi:hypothetical protein
MKKITFKTLVLLLILLSEFSFSKLSNAQTPFTPGNLIVVRVGSGFQSLSNQSQLIKLIEMTPAGSTVQEISLPYNSLMESGGNNKIVAQGSSSNDANITLSGNGQYFVLGGYSADTGIATISGVQGVKRVICRVAMDGSWDTKTLMDTAKSKGNVRSVASNDGSGFWLVGNNTGIRYLPYLSTGAGNDTATIVSTTVTNIRTIQTYDGDLIVGTGSGSVRVGKLSGFPTTSGNTLTTLPGIPSTLVANSIYMTNLPGGPSGANTMYVASDAAPGGIRKYCLNSITGNWDSIGTIESSVLFRGLSGSTSGSSVSIFTIRSTSPHLVSYIDASGYNGVPTATATTISIQPTNTAYRGVQVIPNSFTPLPITLLSFDAIKQSNSDLITWKTSNEINNDYFVVEHSTNAKMFRNIGQVKANALNGYGSYQLLNESPANGHNYYRLAQVDLDGKTTYSNVIDIVRNENSNVSIYPNPATNSVTISMSNMQKGNLTITLKDMTGKTIKAIHTNVTSNTFSTQMNLSSVSPGSYVIEVSNKNVKLNSEVVIIN